MTDYNAFKKAAIRGNDEIVTCPYNPFHQIMKRRLLYHLVKCEKQHVEMELEICPFNTTHRIPKPELQIHKIECPDRRIIETYKFEIEDECPMDRNILPDYHHPSMPPSEENWDDGCPLTYEPEKYILNKCVIRNSPMTCSKSVRIQFRQEERRRVERLCSENNEVPSSENSEFLNLKKVPSRLPKSLPKGINPEWMAKLGMGRGSLPWNSVYSVGKSKPV